MRRFNRVLLPKTAEQINTYVADDGRVIIDMRIDHMAIQHLLHEFIAVGSVQFAVDPHHNMYHWVATLPHRMKGFLKRIDRHDRSLRKTHAWLLPILDDFASSSNYVISAAPNPDLPYEIQEAIAELSLSMRPFILGLDHQIQIDINIHRLLSAVKTLRRHAYHPDSRHNLAVLEGIFTSYKAVDIDGLEFATTAPDEVVSTYKDMIDDASCRLLSTHIHGMGFSEHVEYSRMNVRRMVRDLTRKPRFLGLLKIGQQVIFAPTGTSLSMSSSLSQLIGGDYLPPVANLGMLVHQAREAWKPDSIDIRTIDRQRQPISITQDLSLSWNPYHHVSNAVREVIDSNAALGEVRISGVSILHGNVERYSTTLNAGVPRLELSLSKTPSEKGSCEAFQHQM